MKSGLHCADRSFQRQRRFFKRQVEDILEQHCRALVGRQRANQMRRRIAQFARQWGVGSFGFGHNGGLRLVHSPEPVDPKIACDAEQVGAQVLDRIVNLGEADERADQRFLHQVFRVPDCAGQSPAISIQFGPHGLGLVDEFVPCLANLVGEIA
jgi:hypothetical protein